MGLLFVHPSAPQLAVATDPPGAAVAQAIAAPTTQAAVQVKGEVITRTLLPPAPPNMHGAVPVGKGMWIWQPERAEGGNPQAIVAKAQRYGINYLYVRTGSTKQGFHGGPFLDAILPAAHAAGIRVYGWDFPYLDDIGVDVARAAQAARHTAPGGHRIDGFAADIEFRSMGVNISADTTGFYGYALRDAVGPGFPLIAVIPRPNPATAGWPFESAVKMFDAVAPMIYWMHTDPAVAVRQAWQRLAPLGKPIIPVGQAYDGFAEGGPPGVPNRHLIHRFMGAVADHGGTSVSFWSWQHATDEVWQAVSDAALFQLPVDHPSSFRPDQVRAFQALLSSLGFGVPATGTWGEETYAAVRAFQARSRLPVTGVIDAATRALLLHPVGPPLK
ncbi:MAG TPA: peptidoglycan-binding domain-containing protein [Acidimicrobiales bacterium]|nr:peptidoglycan-binding domain-containing protein [Acidimicrobiales bacterium]